MKVCVTKTAEKIKARVATGPLGRFYKKNLGRLYLTFTIVEFSFFY